MDLSFILDEPNILPNELILYLNRKRKIHVRLTSKKWECDRRRVFGAQYKVKNLSINEKEADKKKANVTYSF